MTSSIPRFSFLVSVSILFIVSTTSMSLHASILTFIRGTSSPGSTTINFDHNLYPAVDSLPVNLNDTNTKLSLSSSVMAGAISSACLAFTLWFWPNSKRVFPLSPIPTLIYALLFNALLCIIATAYTHIIHGQSAVFDAYYRHLHREYDRGVFDVEAWTCQINQYASSLPDRTCWTAKASRFVDIGTCVAAVVAAGVGIWALRRERMVVYQARKSKVARDAYWLGTEEE